MDISTDEFHRFFHKSPDKKVLKSLGSDSKLGTDPSLEEELAEKVMSRIRQHLRNKGNPIKKFLDRF